MGRVPLYPAIAIFLLISSGIIDKNPGADDSVTDLKLELDTVYDESGLADHYKARIITPICEAKKCYSVEIVFYWDLIGRFTRYDTIPGAGLTKLDHHPFLPQDYVRLGEILNDEHSILASYTKDELVQNSRSSEIDGFTGATIQEIKAGILEGAVYSCYSLWHIAHGPICEKLKSTTCSMLDVELVNKLVNMKDKRINYFLIDRFSPADFMKYKQEVLHTLVGGEGYYAKNAIERMPSVFFADTVAQSYFASNFSQFNYFTQVALLEQLKNVNLNTWLIDTLRNHSEDKNTYRNELIDQLLSAQN